MNVSVCVRNHGQHIPVYFNIILAVSGGWVIYFLCQVVVIYAMTLKGISLVRWGYFFSLPLSFLSYPYSALLSHGIADPVLLSHGIAGESFTSIF